MRYFSHTVTFTEASSPFTCPPSASARRQYGSRSRVKFNRNIVRSSSSSFGNDVPHNLGLNPPVRGLQTRAQRLARLPAEFVPDEPVIRVASSDTLRPGDVVFADLLTGNICHEVDKLVDRDHLLRTYVDRTGEA